MSEVSCSEGKNKESSELLQSSTCCWLMSVNQQPREAKNLNVCWSVMFIKAKPENKNVYCEREQKIVTENSFHDRLLAGQQVGSVM